MHFGSRSFVATAVAGSVLAAAGCGSSTDSRLHRGHGSRALPATAPATSGPVSAVMRVDARTRTARVISVGRFPSTIAASDGAIGVMNELDHSVSVLDGRTASVVRTVRLSDPIMQRPRQITPGGIAIHDGRLWLTVQDY